ncbi:MAG: HIT family protein [Nitrospirota bacterium]|nr:HIT family protein [Nitrospirota bacterium]MDE3243916.1 HIT family protein [Nitrospirota bacterium]
MTCKACNETWPPPHHRIADFDLTVAYLFEDQFFPGWTVLVLKRHATELYELTEEERSQMIEEVTAMAKALAFEFQPVKMNYELLGNQLPHIHWHIIPRLAGDPAPLQAVWTVPHQPKSLDEQTRASLIVRLQTALHR